MTDVGLYAVLTLAPLVAMAWLGPRIGPSRSAPLVTWRTWHGVVLWLGAGALAAIAEAAGQVTGLWQWQQPWQPAVHAWWWWASLVAIGLFRLRPLGSGRWYVVQLLGTLAFELPQQALLGWVDHAEMLGSPYATLVAVHVVVTGAVVVSAPALALRLGLLRRSWGT